MTHVGTSAPSAVFTPEQSSFLQLEAQSVWDRHKQLQEKNKTIMETVLKLYSVLLVFAAAPFTREGMIETGFSRVWGLGGVWLALAAWIYSDRSFRAYGGHLLEQVFCMRQIAQIREMIMGSAPIYKTLSLLPPSHFKSYKLSHVSSSQVKYTAYFYKLLSFFTPMYLCLFVCMIFLPSIMLNPKIHATRSIYLRVALGSSMVFFFWLGSSMKRCYGLQQEAFRARRISGSDFWPKFPDEKELNPSLIRKQDPDDYDWWEDFLVELRKPWWSFRKWVNWPFWGLCYFLAVFNAMRLLQLFFRAPYVMIAPTVNGTEHEMIDAALKAYWWQPLDWKLFYATAAIFIIRFLFLEIDLRTIMRVAAANFPVPTARSATTQN